VDADDREDFTTALEVAAHRTEHLNAFMSRFAEVVRMPQPELHPCDVHRMLKELAVLLKPECEQRRIEWMWDVQQQVQPVQMDQYQMERAFVNILKNAIEAIGQNGTLTIRLGLEDETPFVIIEDTGAGLTPEVQAGLFTPFFSTKPDGHGLGLILVQEILNRHGFDFSLERVGDVTRFRINFENPINVV
jgi:signal transduction histidine kinase